MGTGSLINDYGRLFTLVVEVETTYSASMLGNSSGDTVGKVTTFQIGTGMSDPSASNTSVESGLTLWAEGGTVTYKSVETSRFYDTDAIERIMFGLVGFNEGNSSTITKSCRFSTSTTPVMVDDTTHTGISKTASIQILYEWIDVTLTS